MISLGRTDREQISLTHAAVNAPTPAPASNNRNLSRRRELVDAMSLAVEGGVKNCPSWLRRTRSSAPLWSRLASSAIASGSGLSAASFKGTGDAERRPCRPFRAFGYTLRGRSAFTGTLRYPKSCLRKRQKCQATLVAILGFANYVNLNSRVFTSLLLGRPAGRPNALRTLRPIFSYAAACSALPLPFPNTMPGNAPV